MIISCDIKDGNENLAERSTLALNSDIIKKQFEGIIAKFDITAVDLVETSSEKIDEAAISIRIRQVRVHTGCKFRSGYV